MKYKKYKKTKDTILKNEVKIEVKKRSELKNEVWKKKVLFWSELKWIEVNKRSELCEVKKWSQVKNEVHSKTKWN